MLITGGFFFVSVAATLVFGILDGSLERSIYLIIPLLILLGIGFGTAYARHEMIKEMIGLVDELIQAERGRDIDHA